MITSPEMIQPNLAAKSIAKINFQGLYDLGFRILILDKDNTLTLHNSNNIEKDDIILSLEKAKEIFGNKNIAVFTNNDKIKEITINHKSSGIFVIESFSKKPFCEEDVINHFVKNSGLNEVDIRDPKKYVIIGDRLMTDVALAYRMGSLGIYVEPFELSRESANIRQARKFENFIWKNLQNLKKRNFFTNFEKEEKLNFCIKK